MLADRKALDFHAPVARYWPEFAAEGKGDVKVSHLMSHAAGLSGWRTPMTMNDLYDWEKCTSLLAAQAPFWKPGTACGYHAVTQGYLVGEVIRRVAGQTVGAFFQEQVAQPLGADFHIGLPPSEDHRVAGLIEPAGGAQLTTAAPSEVVNNMRDNPCIEVCATKTRAWRGAEIPAAGGTGNARSVALVHAILANAGEAQGKRFLSEAGCRKALEPQIEGIDLILAIPVRYGIGFGLPARAPMPSPNTIFWGGYGGHLAIIDMDARTTIAYTMSRMAPTTVGDMRGFGLAMAFWRSIGLI
jgi:CubicO group peptidase (beta-lactamase class C family)